MIANLMIVILNMNLKEDTIELIDSLLAAGAKLDQIILIDNNSNDGSVQAIREKYGNSIHVIENQENVGFAAGNNQGYELAVNLGAEWVLLINNDTLVASDFFAHFETVRLSDPSFQILAPLIFYFSEPKIVWHMGADRIHGTLLAINKNQKKEAPNHLPLLLPVDFISGCAMFVHIDVYREIGLFDPRFFIYWEEVDFCHRARKSGFKIGIITKSKMWHKVSLTMGKVQPFRRYLYTRNMIFYFRKNSNGFQLYVMAIYSLMRFFTTFMLDLVNLRFDLLSPLFRGFLDGWSSPGF